MKRFYVLLALLSAFVFSAELPAQGSDKRAERIVSTTVTRLKRSPLKCDFSLVYYDGRNQTNEVQKGHFIMDAEKLRLTMSGIETIFDGKTQWVYMASNNEVTITEPTPEEMKDISPIVMIDYYTADHRIVMDAEASNDEYAVINFYPVDLSEAEYFRISLKVKKESELPVKLVIWQRNADTITFNWENIEPVKVDGDSFSFRQEEYPNVVVNDLR